MLDWYNSFPGFIQGIIVTALTATLLLVIQIIIMLFGFGESDFDGDFDGLDGDPLNDSDFFEIFGLKVLSIRNAINFLAVGGWVCVWIYDGTQIIWLSTVLGVVAGIIQVILFSLGMKAIISLQTDGTKDINNCVGKKASVYLKIPANKQGFGKINVLVQDGYTEYNAVTTDDREIPTGSEVVVIEVINDYVVVRAS